MSYRLWCATFDYRVASRAGAVRVGDKHENGGDIVF